MAIDIRVPALGESVTEATVGKWFKKPGDAVKADEPLVELETEKVTVEVPAPAAGVMGEIKVAEGTTVAVGTILGAIREGSAPSATKATDSKPASPAAKNPAPQPKAAMPPAPAARKAMAENAINPAAVEGTGKRGQILKGDVLQALERAPQATKPASVMVASAVPMPAPVAAIRAPSAPSDVPREERVRMTKLRQTIARRLKDAQNSAAMLSTFNDVDMGGVMKLRTEYKDLFEKKHGVRLGFMGFFVKACCLALKEIPAVNAEIDGTDIIYKNYYHVGVAVSTEKGLVVPVLRDADQMSLADVEMPSPISASARATARSASRRCRAALSPSPTAACLVP